MRNMRLCLIIALILSSICGTSYAEYTLGQPVPLDTRPVTTGSTGWFQSNPAITSSGSIYLAVWVDMRDAGRGSDLYATRIAADGTVLDPLGIRLTTHASVTGKPDVCWNGVNFYVVYANNTGVVGTSVLGMRVSPGGEVLDEQPVVISNTGNARNPQVSWDGTNNVVGYADIIPNPGYHIPEEPNIEGAFVRRVSVSGSVIDTEPIITFMTSDFAMASSPDGTTFVVCSTKTDSSDIYGAIVDYSPDALAGEFVICDDAGIQDMPDVCWAGGQFIVVWQDGDQSRSIRGRRISTSGSLLDPTPLSISSVTEKQSDPQVAWNGTNCLVTWMRKTSAAGQVPAQFDIYAGRVYSDGTLLDGSGFPVCTAEDRQMKPCVGSLGLNFLVCWMDSRSAIGPTVTNLGYQVRGRRIYSTGILAGEEFPLAKSAPQHKVSCSAYNGRQFLVCFDEWRDGARNLYGELIDAYTGAPVTSEPFVISPLVVENACPAATWNGQTFVVTWRDGALISGHILPTRILAARITSEGTVLDPAAIVVYEMPTSPISTPPAIASNGNRCLIVYRYVTVVMGRFLERDGTTSATFTIGTSKSRSVYEGVAVCWTGQNYIVAWKQAYSTTPPATPGGIDCAKVTVDGLLSTKISITDTTFPDYFKLGFDGQNVLLVSYGPEIRTRRLRADLRPEGCGQPPPVIDTTPLTIPDSNGVDCVNLAWNGTDYVLTWLVGNLDTTSAQTWQDDMRFARINIGNQLVDAGSIAVTETLVSEVGGSMCAGPLGRVFMAYSSFEGAPYQSVRVKGFYMDTLLNLTSLSQIPSLYEGAQISMSGTVATALFADRFYVQESRSFGIGITSALTPETGDAVSFTGKLTKLNGETVLDASEAFVVSSLNPIADPVGMAIRKLGGIGPNSAFSTVDGALGLYNIGLLVKVWGKVTFSEGDHFYLDDGSNVPTDPGRTGVKVYGSAPGSTYAKVTGISGAEVSGDKIIRVIRSTDIQPIGGDGGPPLPPL